jgi:hypothetical protein
MSSLFSAHCLLYWFTIIDVTIFFFPFHSFSPFEAVLFLSSLCLFSSPFSPLFHTFELFIRCNFFPPVPCICPLFFRVLLYSNIQKKSPNTMKDPGFLTSRCFVCPNPTVNYSYAVSQSRTCVISFNSDV